MGRHSCGGHDRLNVSLRLAWGILKEDRTEVESPLTSVVGHNRPRLRTSDSPREEERSQVTDGEKPASREKSSRVTE